jgi:peptidyl-prolyl cis-trans isomerase D
MFDLFRSRQKAVRYILGALLLMVALSMVITLIPGYGSTTSSGTDDSVLADIGNQKLTAQEVDRNVQEWVRNGRIQASLIDVYVPQFIDQMVRERAAVYEFQSKGLTVTDDEIMVGLAATYAQFFQNGQFAKDQLTAALAQQGLTLQNAIDDVRHQLMLRKIQNTLFATAVVTPKEVDDALLTKNGKVKIKYIAFPPAKFRDGINPTPQQMQAAFNQRRGEYITPEKRSFDVLVVDQAKIEASLEVTDAQLRQAYAGSMDNFRTPERVKVRHILVKTTDKSDAEKKQALTKAEDLLKQLKGGADFAALAKQNSDDPGSAQNGGALDWVVRGQTVPEFEKVAFSLKPNELSGIVTTQYGYHIIQLLEKQPARVMPFEEVKANLADQLKKDGLTEKMQAIGDQIHAALEKSPGSAAAIAKQFNVDFVSASQAPRGTAIPTLGVSPEIDNALATMKKNDVSPVLVLPANRLVVAVLTDRIPARQSDFNEVENQVKDRVISDASQVMASKGAQEAAEKLKAGADMNQLAKSMKLDVVESIDFTRNDSVEGLGPAATIPDAFKKPVGTIVGPIKIQNRDVVYQVVDKKTPDLSSMKAEREATLTDLKKRAAVAENDLFLDGMLTQLEAEGKVKIHQDAIKRLLASLH